MKEIISIICAPPHGEFNPGMHSVDLGAHSFFSKNFPSATLRFYVLHHPEQQLKDFLYPQLPFSYELLYTNLEEIYKSDLIIFWGDFLQMYPLHRGLSRRLVQYKIAETEENGLDIIREHFLFTHASEETLAKTIVFGSNCFINEFNHTHKTAYGSAFYRFINKVNSIWTRDILSAITIAQIKNDFARNYLGMDCSFFFELKSSQTHSLPLPTIAEVENDTWWKKKTPETNTCGIFLGRMPQNTKELLPFIKEVTKKLNSKTQYIPWFWQTDQHYNIIKAGLPKIVLDNPNPSLTTIYDSIKNYNYIITDTYHLCLNAWRMGVPAICIGEGSSAYENTPLTDKKKELFYAMYGASPLYVFLEDMNKPVIEERIENVCQHICSQAFVHKISSTIRDNKIAIEKILSEHIQQILTP